MTDQNRSLTKFLYSKAHRSPFPLSMTFELSPLCNLSCKMCYVRESPVEIAGHGRSMMTLDAWKRLADEAFNEGTLFVLLTGGEPFLWKDFRDLYEYLHNKGFLVSINTNGTLINEDTVRWLQKYPPARINITMYGANDATYERLCGVSGMYTKVTENIERLLQAGIRTKLNTSMTPYNVQDMEHIIRFSKEHGLLYDVTTYMFPPVRRHEQEFKAGVRLSPAETAQYRIHLKKLEMSESDFHLYLANLANGIAPPPGLDVSCIDPIDGTVSCQAGKGSYWVTWDGLLIPCGMVPHPAADLKELSLKRAWNMISEETAKIRTSGVCENCGNRKVCHACLATAVTETGSYSGIPTYLCQMAEAMKDEAEQLLKQQQK